MIEPFVLAAGRRVGGRYRLERPLGRGGMAAVWLAHDERLEREVAIKVLSDTIADDREFLERFRREATLAARLQHPNLVRVFDFDAGERPYLVMEYVSGGDLARLIRARDTPPPRQLARELLSALRHIHSIGVLHRDVKPQNVLVDHEGHARLTDFGIAQPSDATALTATGKVIGTESYLAPEVLRGEPASERSDLYALGVVLADAIKGGADAGLWSLIDSMRDPDPQRRPGSASSALATLARSGSAEPTGEPTEALDPIGSTPPAGVESARGAAAPPAPSPPAPTRPPLDRRTGPAQPPTPPAARPDRRPRALALGALIAGAAVLVAALAFGGGDEPQSGGDGAKGTAAKAERDAGSDGAGAGQPAADASAGRPAADDSASADGAALNDQGFALINEGRPGEAVPVLEQATAALEGSGDELTYNYALFNLARALRLSGRPEEAIPLLEQRLEYPDQEDVVAAELEAAREDAGLAPADDAAGRGKPKPGKGPKKQVPPPFENDG